MTRGTGFRIDKFFAPQVQFNFQGRPNGERAVTSSVTCRHFAEGHRGKLGGSTLVGRRAGEAKDFSSLAALNIGTYALLPPRLEYTVYIYGTRSIFSVRAETKTRWVCPGCRDSRGLPTGRSLIPKLLTSPSPLSLLVKIVADSFLLSRVCLASNEPLH